MSNIRNKLHIYSVENFELKFCFGDFDIHMDKLMTCAFSKKNKFLSFLFNDLSIHIYSLLKEEENKKNICKCKKHDEENHNLLGNLITGLKVKYYY